MDFSLLYIAPELILTAGGMLVLLSSFAHRKWAEPGRIGLLSPETLSAVVLLCALVPTVMLMKIDWGEAGGIAQFGGTLAVDSLALFFKAIAIVSSIIVVLLSVSFFPGVAFHRGEYYALLVFATLAISCLSASADLIMIYLSLEFLSITSYVLVGYLKQDPRSNEAAVKYFLFGCVATAVMIYGMSILYGVSGSTNILKIASTLLWSTTPYSVFFLSTILVLVGLGFKVSMVPFHQWAPDAYEGAPTPITAFLSVGSKAAGVAVLVRVLATGMPPEVFDWRPFVALLSAFTMTVGNLVAMPQVNIKRMLAYSSIAHAGYMLIGVVAMGYKVPLGLPSVLLYFTIYLFMNLGAFGVVTILSAKLRSDEIRDYSGLMKRAPAAAVAMVFFMLSLAGIPPTAGFLGKFYVFSAALQHENRVLFWLAVIAIVNTVAALYYYMNVVRHMFFTEAASADPIPSPRPIGFVVGVSLVMTLLILIYPQPFIQLAYRSAMMLSGM